MKRKVSKAVFPVAGMGTRFLPATKSVPKEIMTLVDRPLVQYAIDEARAAGIKEFIFVTARGKSALEDYFDVAGELVASLKAKGKTAELAVLETTQLEPGRIAYVRQQEPAGLGHAVWCARFITTGEPFAVRLKVPREGRSRFADAVYGEQERDYSRLHGPHVRKAFRDALGAG